MVLDGVILLWYILVVLSLAFTLWDCFTNTPVSWVQKLAWILVVFYTGPIGLFMYLMACRSPGRGMHDAFTKPLWKQALNSEMHCVAGDATGIIIAAFVLSFFFLPNGIDLILEYVSGFVCGLFIFQALMMLSMYGNNYLKAVRKTFFAETVSMNMVMTGMIPPMLLLKAWVPEAESPSNLHFWFVMGMATIVGGIVAYPINYWLVKNHLKHGCMTLPEKGQKDAGMKMPMDKQGCGAMEGMNDGSKMEMGKISLGSQVAWIAGTYIILFVVTWITSWFVPLHFS